MPSDSPLISVLMPAFNCGRFIEQAIESIVRQSYLNWELLICDDGSSDESTEIMKKFVLTDKRIRFFVNSENCGAAYTKNFLLGQSKGEFIALMDADDLCSKDRLLHQLIFVKENGLDACGTHHCTIDESGQILEQHLNFCSYQRILWSAFNNFSFCNASLFIKKECLLKIGGYKESLKTEAEDIDMLFRFLLCRYKIQTMDKMYYMYRQHPESASQRRATQQKANSYSITKCLLSEILDVECSDDFVRFMKYFHRPDFTHQGNCMLHFNTLRAIVNQVEYRILGGRFNDAFVKQDIARKLLFLSLNHRRENRINAFVLLVRSVFFFPRIVCLTLRDKWRVAL